MVKNMAIVSLLVTVFMSGVVATAMAREYGDIYMDSRRSSMKKAEVKAVLFPHWFHRIRYKCKVCHEDIFIMKKGANDLSMKKIMDGKACGTCHNGLIAWEPLYCERCHSAEFETVAGTRNAKQ